MTNPQNEEHIDMLQDAAEKLEEVIELCSQVASETNDRSKEAYLIAHLENWLGGDRSNPYDEGIQDWIDELSGEDTEDN